MNIVSFYKIYYRHRVAKANFLRKLYLFFVVPIRYLVNIPFFPKKMNLDEHSKLNLFLYEKKLDFLFEYFNSDKGNFYVDQYMQPIKNEYKRIEAHGYADTYEKYFLPLKNSKLNILEIGSFYGNAAAALYFYFKNSDIYSADVYPDLFRYSSKRTKNFYIDSSSEESITNVLLKKEDMFNIIIEDASHVLKDQIISLFMLFKKLKPGGLFICEELDFPEKRQDMNLNNEYPSLKEILINKMENKDFESKYISKEDKKYFLDNVKSIKIYKGKVNEIAIIIKK